MKLRVATPRDGMQWMLSGVHMARHHTLGLAGLFGLQIFALALLLGLPWFGPVLVAALLPALSVHEPIAQSPNIRLLPFRDPPPSRQIALVWRKSSATDEFLRRLAEAIGTWVRAQLPQT